MNLTKRETEILYLVSIGKTTNEIASILFLSSHTIITHRKKLLVKMQVNNVAVLMRKAFETGLLKLELQAA